MPVVIITYPHRSRYQPVSTQKNFFRKVKNTSYSIGLSETAFKSGLAHIYSAVIQENRHNTE